MPEKQREPKVVPPSDPRVKGRDTCRVSAVPVQPVSPSDAPSWRDPVSSFDAGYAAAKAIYQKPAAPSPVLMQPSAKQCPKCGSSDKKKWVAACAAGVPDPWHFTLEAERPVLPVPPEIKTLILHAKQLLDWVPTCSKGSSGFVRQENLRKSIEEIEVMNATS